MLGNFIRWIRRGGSLCREMVWMGGWLVAAIAVGSPVNWSEVQELEQRDLPQLVERLAQWRGQSEDPAERAWLGALQAEIAGFTGRATEAKEILENLAPPVGDDPSAALARTLVEATRSIWQDDTGTGQALFARAAEEAEALGLNWLAAWASDQAADLAALGSDLEAISELSRQTEARWERAGIPEAALARRIALGYVPGAVELTTHLGHLDEGLKRFSLAGRMRDLALTYSVMGFDAFEGIEAAKGAFETAGTLARQVGDRQLESMVQLALAQIAIEEGALDEAREAVVRAEALAALVGPWGDLEGVERVHANVLIAEGSASSLREAEAILRGLEAQALGRGDEEVASYVRLNLGDCLRALGRPAEAEAFLRPACDFFRQRGDLGYLRVFLESLRGSLEEQGKWEEALGIADEIFAVRYERWNTGESERVAVLTARKEAELRQARLEVAEGERELAVAELNRRERELDAMRANEARERTTRHATIVLLVFATAGSVLFGLLYRQKRRAQHRIADLVEQLRSEKQLLAEEVAKQRRLADELHRTNAQLRLVDAERRRLLSVAAHDMRNPLGVIDQCIELMESEMGENTSDEMRELFELSRGSVLFLYELLEGSLAARRREEPSAEHLELRWLEPAALVQQMVLLNDVKARQKDIVLECISLVPAHTRVYADSLALRSCLDNLLSNAIKFSPEGSQIWIRLAEDRGRLELAVEDQGPGLAEEDFPRLFTEFGVLSAKATGGESSTGLGLSMVKRQVEAMGGQVQARNRDGGGARFSLFLRASFEPQVRPGR